MTVRLPRRWWVWTGVGLLIAGGPVEGALPDSASTDAPPTDRIRLNLFPDEQMEVEFDENDLPIIVIEDRMSRTRLRHESHGLDFDLWGRYDRVEGPALFAGVNRALQPDDFIPAYHAEFGYAFSGKRSQYRIGLDQPFVKKNKLSVGAEGYRQFTPFFYDHEVMDSDENTANALFVQHDWWDWYEAEGVRGTLTFRPSRQLTWSAGIDSEQHRALGVAATWSVIKVPGGFRENPAALGGDYRAYRSDLTFDTRPRDEYDESPDGDRWGWGGVEHWYRLRWERADAGLGGDFDLWRVWGDFRTYFRLTNRQHVSLRVVGGSGETAGGGVLPPQRRFTAGGLGTLHGQDYKSQSGNRLALANLEYSFALGRKVQALFFTDAGRAWDRGTLWEQRIAVDVGAGLRAGEEGITFLLARNINRSDAEVKAYLRLQQTF